MLNYQRLFILALFFFGLGCQYPPRLAPLFPDGGEKSDGGTATKKKKPSKEIAERRSKKRKKKSAPPQQLTWTIRKGDTLQEVLIRLGVRPTGLRGQLIDELADFIDFRKIRPGERVTVFFEKKPRRLRWLRYFRNPLNEWEIKVCWRGQSCYESYYIPKGRKKSKGRRRKKRRLPRWLLETRKISERGRVKLTPITAVIGRDGGTFTAALQRRGELPSLAARVNFILGKRVNMNRVFGGERLDLWVEKISYRGKTYGYRHFLYIRFVPKRRGRPVVLLYYPPPNSKGGRSNPGAYFSPEGFRSLKEKLFAFPIVPFRPGRRRFGMRFHPILRRWRMHYGVDFTARCGHPLRAIASGRVITSGWRGGAGKMLSIRHPGGWVARYMHLSRFAVRRGRRVKRGQVVGYVGTTGLSTGCHLHFELLRWGRHLDPLKVFKLRKNHTLTCRQMRLFWKTQVRACRALKLSVRECGLTIPRRCRRSRHRYYLIALVKKNFKKYRYRDLISYRK